MLDILNAEPNGFDRQASEILASLGRLHERAFSQAELLEHVGDYDVLLVRLGLQVDAEVLGAAKRLRAVVTPTTGLDHIDVEEAERRQVAVLSLRGENEFLRRIPATAEHTWALLLALVRRIPQAAAAVKAGSWDRDAFRGGELRGRRLGLVGVGRIGTKVARYGRAFGMRVHGHDPAPRQTLPRFPYRVTLDELLSASDVLSIHVPYDPTTRHLLGAEQLGRLPRGSLLVNTSRGGVLDETALLDALTSGHVAGAALDVLEDEHRIRAGEGSALIEYARAHDNLLITPHIGGATHESMRATERYMARRLATFIRGPGGRQPRTNVPA